MPKKASNRRPLTPGRESILALGTGLPESDDVDKSSDLISVGELQATRIEIAALRHVRPADRPVPKTDIAVVDASSQRVVLAGISYDFAAGSAQGLQERVVEFADLDGLVFSELLQGFSVVCVEFRKRQGVFSIRDRRYGVAIVGGQSVPQLLVDAERQYGARFMEPGVIVELRYLVQSQDHVVPRTDPFAGIDRARFQGGRDFASRKVDDNCAKPPQDLPAEARHAVDQSGIAFRALDLLCEPTAHLHARVRRHQWFDVEPGAQFVPQRLPVSEVDPGCHFIGGEAERDGREKIEGWRAFLPIVLSRVVHVGDAARYGIEDLEGADELSRSEDLNFKATVGDLRDPAAKSFSAGAQTGKTFRPTRHYLKFPDALGDGWSRKCGGYARRNAGAGQKAASIHGIVSSEYQRQACYP